MAELQYIPTYKDDTKLQFQLISTG